MGNETLIGALARIKSYLDYGSFTPIQVAAIAALEGDQQCVSDITEMYKRRRDVLCDGLNAMGWEVTPQKQRCLCGRKFRHNSRLWGH